MGFDVVYGPSAKAVGTTGYLAGRGQYNQQQQVIRQRENMQRREISARAATREDQQAFQTERDAQHQEFQTEQRERDFQLEQKGLELRHTKQQEIENAKINQGIEYVRKQVSEGKWTEKEGQAAINQLELRRHGITKMPVISKPSPWPAGQEPGKTWVENSGLMTRDNNGNVKVLVKPPSFSMKEVSDMTNQVRESMTVYGKDKDGKETISYPDDAAVQERVQRQMQSFLNIHKIMIQDQAGQGEAGPQAEPVQQGPQQGVDAAVLQDAERIQGLRDQGLREDTIRQIEEGTPAGGSSPTKEQLDAFFGADSDGSQQSVDPADQMASTIVDNAIKGTQTARSGKPGKKTFKKNSIRASVKKSLSSATKADKTDAAYSVLKKKVEAGMSIADMHKFFPDEVLDDAAGSWARISMGQDPNRVSQMLASMSKKHGLELINEGSNMFSPDTWAITIPKSIDAQMKLLKGRLRLFLKISKKEADELVRREWRYGGVSPEAALEALGNKRTSSKTFTKSLKARRK